MGSRWNLVAIQAEMYDIAFVLPVNGGYVWFTSNPDVGDTTPTVLLDPENVGVAVGIPLPAAIQDLQSELQVFPVSRPPFWFPVEHDWILA